MKKIVFVLGISLSSFFYGQNISEVMRAAEQGQTDAQTRLGIMYYEGQGVRQSYELATKWYTKAAEQGDVVAQVLLGIMYIEGKGGVKDITRGKYWVKKSCEGGFLEACAVLRKVNNQ